MPLIVVTRRSDDWHACIKDIPQCWGCGNSPNAAIGDLVLHHQERFRLKVSVE